jgi:dTDP-4-amino-4,6-dideoxygalactose transaminase
MIREYGSEFDLDSNNEYYIIEKKEFIFKDAELFRSGRDALRAVAQKHRNKCKRVVLPALCCESMVQPFQFYKYNVLFYKLNSEMSASIDDILHKLRQHDIFIYMNYFGIQSIKDEILQSIRENFPKLIMIEDKTHDILSINSNEFIPNYTVCSIRKWLAIPDGGLLYSNKMENKFVKKMDDRFADIRQAAIANKSEYLKYGDNNIKELFRDQFHIANMLLNLSTDIVGISSNSYEILKEINFSKMAHRRENNYDLLMKKLTEFPYINSILSNTTRKANIYFPILVENRDYVQSELAQNNIYCPVIWPLPHKAVKVCKTCDYISSHIIALPCDQRYDECDMLYIIETLKSILGD